jgi:hypothetical protein
VSDDLKHAKVVKDFRLPSLRAKCPVAISQGKSGWVVVAGTDAGDIYLCEEHALTLSLSLHEVTVVALEWLRTGKTFISGDISSTIGLWTKSC